MSAMSRTLSVAALSLILSAAQAKAPTAEAAIESLVSDMTAAWNRGDAVAFTSAMRDDVIYTDLGGAVTEGREALEQKFRGILSGAFQGTTLAQTVRRVKLVRPDVAIVDLDTSVSRASGPTLRTSALLVLARDGRRWTIAALHNTGVPSTAAAR
jgi:uncharacterized protein (TIGR02246 family)